MRTNNAKVKNIIISVYFILIVFAILLATVFSAFQDLTPNPYLTFFIIVAFFIFLLLFFHAVSRYFEYDSDGFKVIVINRGMVLSDYFNYREKRVEFEKEQLVRFKFFNFYFYRRLVLHLKNGEVKTKKEKFNVTLVAKKKRKYIKQSLSKMIKQNRKLYHS
ncbi:MAG: hypothetical protein R3213_03810 [Flavobacteriaceae bacterium]|nr:hypothetical protein [Flavobacteriaceae bacterium]